MPTCWHKRDWWPSDMDRSNPYKPEFVPGAIPPGIFCEDQEGFAALRRKVWETEPSMTYRPDGQASIGGINVYVATPEQARVWEEFAPKGEEPSYDQVSADYLEARERFVRAEMLKAFRAFCGDRQAPPPPPPPPPRPPSQPPAMKHPFSGTNRKGKRAAKAQARRRA